jgi:hypothetical protein
MILWRRRGRQVWRSLDVYKNIADDCHGSVDDREDDHAGRLHNQRQKKTSAALLHHASSLNLENNPEASHGRMDLCPKDPLNQWGRGKQATKSTSTTTRYQSHPIVSQMRPKPSSSRSKSLNPSTSKVLDVRRSSVFDPQSFSGLDQIGERSEDEDLVVLPPKAIMSIDTQTTSDKEGSVSSDVDTSSPNIAAMLQRTVSFTLFVCPSFFTSFFY